jgi:hypothetical protein
MLGTRLYRHLSTDARRDLAQLGGCTVPEGADTVVWLASSPDVDGVSGKFFERRAEVACEFRDEVAEERLWEACERLVSHLEPQR